MKELSKEMKQIPDYIKKDFRKYTLRHMGNLKLELRDEIRSVKSEIGLMQETLQKLVDQNNGNKSPKRRRNKTASKKRQDDTSSTERHDSDGDASPQKKNPEINTLSMKANKRD